MTRPRLLQEKNVSRTRCIVEVGSSCGHFLQRFIDYTDELIGIESSGECCDYVASNYSIKTICGLFEELDPQELSGKASLVICSHVIEHSCSPRDFIQCLWELLSWNGYLYLEVPSTETLALVRLPGFRIYFSGT